ncbi:MAG TPA: nucleotidyltransferase domain-containing protein [Rhizomicrobium sp.]|jgi:predicted nucleotidyltransferase|nr:nucleotidyltransferase domain-containing protein [Rhizomicrobium sp.]
MGTADTEPGGAQPIGLAGALFSNVQLKVLALIFTHPDRSFYTRQIVNTLNSGTGAVARELTRLERSGLVLVEKIGNQKHYRANCDAAIFPELQSILRKTVGLHDPLKSALAPFLDRIKAAFVYGSVASGKDTARSDIDLLVIGDDLTYSDIFGGVQEAEKTLARRINPNILDTASWKKRQAGKNHFVSSIIDAPKIFIVGSEKDLMRERQSREPG